MPLTYDDIPGSWGYASVHWPAVAYFTADEADRAYVACSKENIVPYGSYVIVGNTLRVETEAMLETLLQHIEQSPLKTADAVLAHYGRTK